MRWYAIDKNHNVSLLPEHEYWTKFRGNISEWRVGQDEVGNYRVSTVFLSLDHSWDPIGPPMLFETMVFPLTSLGDEYCKRYSSWDEAAAGHKKVVDALQAGVPVEKLE